MTTGVVDGADATRTGAAATTKAVRRRSPDDDDVDGSGAAAAPASRERRREPAAEAYAAAIAVRLVVSPSLRATTTSRRRNNNSGQRHRQQRQRAGGGGDGNSIASPSPSSSLQPRRLLLVSDRDAVDLGLLHLAANAGGGGGGRRRPRPTSGAAFVGDDESVFLLLLGRRKNENEIDRNVVREEDGAAEDTTTTQQQQQQKKKIPTVVGVGLYRAAFVPPAGVSGAGVGGSRTQQQQRGGGRIASPPKPGTVRILGEDDDEEEEKEEAAIFRACLHPKERKAVHDEERVLREKEREDEEEAIVDLPPTTTPCVDRYSYSFKDAIDRGEVVLSKTPTPNNNNEGRRKSGGTGSGAATTPTAGSESRRPKGVLVLEEPPPLAFWMVASRSSLGRWIRRRVCVKAAKVRLRCVVDDTGDDDDDSSGSAVDATASAGGKILARIALAHLAGRFVRAGERARISFRGRSILLLIDSVVASGDCDFDDKNKDNNFDGNTGSNDIDNSDEDFDEQDDQSLEVAFADLALDDDDVASAVASSSSSRYGALSTSEVKRAVVAAASRGGVRLFRIDYSTSVEFVSRSGNVDSEEVAASAHQIQQKRHFVAGLSGTLEQVRSLLVVPLTKTDMFKNALAKPPKGILLYGPSGCGKSSLIRQISRELEPFCDVHYVNCTSIQTRAGIVGEAERHLFKLFLPPANSKPKLLVLDDIHLICPKRGGYNPGADRLSATLLSLIDGIDSHKNRIVVLAATYNPSLLDPALRRPGRLDTEVEVPTPDGASTRAEILKFQVAALGALLVDDSSSAIDDDDDWLDLGKLAKGFNGADCTLAVKEAIRKTIIKALSEDVATPSPVPLSKDVLVAAIKGTKPSAVKSITVEIPQVHWSSIGGMESVKRELREAVELPLTHAGFFERYRVPPPRGVLLYGPPGCSKTLMARALATESQMNFLAVKGPELLSKWLGESERALASLFRRARMASPAIIFFDEIDAIAMKRGSGDSASSSRLLSQLLTELDGVNNTGGVTTTGNKPQRVVVIGATNRPDLLDAALTRPGRIDKMIYVGVPDAESRARIFQISLADRVCSEDVDVQYLASDELSEGFSGAEIVAISRDAALLSLEESSSFGSSPTPVIEMRHLIAASESMKRQITPEMQAFYASYQQVPAAITSVANEGGPKLSAKLPVSAI